MLIGAGPGDDAVQRAAADDSPIQDTWFRISQPANDVQTEMIGVAARIAVDPVTLIFAVLSLTVDDKPSHSGSKNSC
jgi:hypothetical protein